MFPLNVGIVTIFPLQGEAKHFLLEGINGSEYLDLVGVVSLYNANNTQAQDHTQQTNPLIQNHPLQPTDASVWIVDGARVAKFQRQFLTTLLEAKDPTWKVLFIDFTDQFQFQLRKYQKLNVWNKPHVRLAVRSIVRGRHYTKDTGDQQKGYIVRGSVAPNLATAGGPMLHYPYAMRSDILEVLHQEVTSRLQNTDSPSFNNNSTISISDIVSWERPIDVVHLWQVSFKEGKSKLRNDVSRLVRSWNRTLRIGNSHIVKTSIDEQGERMMIGRNTVDPAYVRALLSAKIVIVTQKDDWEDHYRLLESLGCGALVVHDRMLAPPRGYIHGENILFFDTMEELEKLVVQYLENDDLRLSVARKGRELAMQRHRAWHRMEEVLFGRPLTSVRQ